MAQTMLNIVAGMRLFGFIVIFLFKDILLLI